MIVDLNGTSPVTFDVGDNSYYVVVYTRNHLEIMNASVMSLNNAAAEAAYDFTTGQSQAYGTDPLAELGTGSGVYGMIGGDSNHDGNITVADNNLIMLKRNTEGYEDEDINMDGNVTVADNNQAMTNRNKSTQVPTASAPTNNSKPQNTKTSTKILDNSSKKNQTTKNR